MECKRIVIDTDPGVDDAHAILILLDADKLNLVKIEAIIVTKGNTTVENGSKHVVRLLQMKNRTDVSNTNLPLVVIINSCSKIPVYRGVQYALLSNEEGASTYFGNDGMADLDYDEEPDLTFLSVKPAPLALLELVEQNPNEITLVCLAPLTNVALAASLRDNFFEKVKEVFIMGGNWRDTDPGIDDLYAILIFLEAEKLNLIKIEAFTVTAGNTDLENACKNLICLLEKANRTDIPIYKGSSRNLLSEEQAFDYYGDNGVGNFVYSAEPDVSIIRGTPSVIALKEIIDRNPGEITLVCLGPLTNIALAYKIYEDIFNNVKEIFIMGGTCRGRGNITICAEFNFYFDPESVYVFLKNVTCPTTILPYEPCRDTELEANWWFSLLLNNTPELQFLTEMDKHHHAVAKKRNRDKWMQPDLYLAVMILCPDLIVRKNLYHMTIELHGDLTRGQCIFDHTKEDGRNILIVEEISKEIYVETLLKIFKVDR